MYVCMYVCMYLCTSRLELLSEEEDPSDFLPGVGFALASAVGAEALRV